MNLDYHWRSPSLLKSPTASRRAEVSAERIGLTSSRGEFGLIVYFQKHMRYSSKTEDAGLAGNGMSEPVAACLVINDGGERCQRSPPDSRDHCRLAGFKLDYDPSPTMMGDIFTHTHTHPRCQAASVHSHHQLQRSMNLMRNA